MNPPAALESGDSFHVTPLNPPAPLGSSDSFADRSPTGIATFNLNLRSTSLRWTPPGNPRKWRQLRESQPHRDGE
eukprot:1292052-Pyramimonas_sp.AAC.1